MSNNGGSIFITPKERIVERGRGCWSCVSFENGELSRNLWKERKQRDIAILDQMAKPVLPRIDEESKPDERFEEMDKLVASGAVGLCMRGKVQTDFVHHQFLCDAWTGKTGSSVATAGRPLDKLPDELREMIDGRKK